MGHLSICFHGLVAFLVAAVLADALLVGLAFSALRSLIQARQRGKPFYRHPLYPHLIGVSVSLFCCVVIMLFTGVSLAVPRPHPLNIWLDDFALLWAALVLALWPASSYAIRRVGKKGE